MLEAFSWRLESSTFMVYLYIQWCSPRDQTLGLEAPRGQKIVLVLVLTKKSWEFSRLLWVWLIAGTTNNNLGRDWVLVLFSTVLSELVYIRPTVFFHTQLYACRVYTVLFILWPWYGNLFSGPGKVLVLVLTKKSWSWSWKKSLIYITVYINHERKQTPTYFSNTISNAMKRKVTNIKWSLFTIQWSHKVKI